MGLNFKRWLLTKLGDGQQRIDSEEITAEECFSIGAELYIRELTFWSCVHLVADAVSKCEFKTFSHGVEIKDVEYYLWNVEPNRNQNSSAFLRKLIAQLFQNNEALIIEQNGQLLVADGFSRKPYAIYGHLFSQVTVGDFTFQRTFKQSEVMHFTLHEKRMRPVVNGLYDTYRKLLDHSMKAHQKSRGVKGVLLVDAIAAGDPKFQETYESIKNNGFRNFANAENGVLPLWKGMSYTELGSKTYSQEGTRDIRAMIDDISDFTAKAFGIPPALLRGDVQGVSDALDQFLTFCIDPLVDMLAEEINRKRSGKQAYMDGTLMRIDTKCIKHVDLLNVSTAIDKLIASGAFCINDIRKLVGDTALNEPWAWQHYITKNYTAVQDLQTVQQEQALYAD